MRAAGRWELTCAQVQEAKRLTGSELFNAVVVDVDSYWQIIVTANPEDELQVCRDAQLPVTTKCPGNHTYTEDNLSCWSWSIQHTRFIP